MSGKPNSKGSASQLGSWSLSSKLHTMGGRLWVEYIASDASAVSLRTKTKYGLEVSPLVLLEISRTETVSRLKKCQIISETCIIIVFFTVYS